MAEFVLDSLTGLLGVLVGGLITYIANIRVSNREFISLRKETISTEPLFQ